MQILLEYQNIKIFFAKICTSNSSEEVFVIKKVKNTKPWAYVINDFIGEEIVGTFYEKELRIEKVIKRKGDKLYVKWKGYNDLFNSWIDKKRHSINEATLSRTAILREKVKVKLDLSNYAMNRFGICDKRWYNIFC